MRLKVDRVLIDRDNGNAIVLATINGCAWGTVNVRIRHDCKICGKRIEPKTKALAPLTESVALGVVRNMRVCIPCVKGQT
jgi:hypothetical protein